MTRVLFVIHFPVFGGPHNQALRLAGPLSEHGFDTVVVVPDETGNAVPRLREAGVDVRSISLHRLRATRNPLDHFRLAVSAPAEIGQLRTLIRSEGISIVQIGGLVNPHAAIAARLEGVPTVWQLVDSRAPWPVATASMLFVRNLAAVVMSTGLSTAKAHPGYQTIADRLIPFFPPVDLGRFAPNLQLRTAVRASWGVSPDELVVGCVANINPQKGIGDLVRAFHAARLQALSRRSVLVLVGAEYPQHAAYSASVRREMNTAGLIEGRDVIFVGDRPDVERHLAGMDIFALAAVPRSEGITTAVLEAMAVGLPAVVTDVGALREAVIHGRTGLLVPPDDTSGFGLALTSLLGDPDRRRRMGQAARQIAVDSFGIESCVDAHLQAYAQALAPQAKGHQAASVPGRRP